MTALGRRIGSEVRFADFGAFNRAEGASDRFIEAGVSASCLFPACAGRIESSDAAAAVGQSARGAARLALDHLHMSDAFLSARHRLYLRRYGVSQRRPNMCAVFSKPG